MSIFILALLTPNYLVKSVTTPTMKTSKTSKTDGFDMKASHESYMEDIINVYKDNYDRVLSGESTELASVEAIKKIINVIKNTTADKEGNAVANETLTNLAKSYEVLPFYQSSENMLIRSRANQDKRKIVVVIGYEDAFNILCNAHRKNAHCDKKRLEEILSNDYEIPSKCYEVFLDSCNLCQNNRSFNKKVQVSILHTSSLPDENFHLILLYRDLWTDYHLLRPLSSDSDEEICIELLKIFTDFGMPKRMYVPVAQRTTFVDSMKMMKKFLPSSCVIVDTMSSKDSEEISTKIDDLMMSWMQTSSSDDWAYGCYEVQMKLNETSNFNAPKNSPYVKVFGELDLQAEMPSTEDKSDT